MRRRLFQIALPLLISALVFAPGASAQQRRLALGPASSALWALPETASAAPAVRIETSDQHDDTVLGLIVGAGVGFAVGWGFYNTMCEAVDNKCTGSRVPYLIFGTSVGAGLGALIGYAAD